MLEIITLLKTELMEQAAVRPVQLGLQGSAEEAEGAYKFVIPNIKDQKSEVLLCSTAHKLLYKGILMRPDGSMRTGRH